MWSRTTIVATVLSLGGVLCGQAFADPFDRPPAGYATAINRRLAQAGIALRLIPEGCQGGATTECRFSSPTVIATVTGRAKPPRTVRITISADLLREEADASPQDLVGDAVAVLGETMTVYDPGLRPSQRDELLSDWIQAVLTNGQSGGDGGHAHYSLAFDQGADGLLVIMITTRP
jgi:hypothetical protein